MTTRQNVGLKIREARIAKGMSQTELGKLLTRSRTHAAISELEHGKVRIDVTELGEIAKLLGVPASTFTNVLTIVSIVRTCESVPAQFEALTDDGHVVYIRYRNGEGRVHVGARVDPSVGADLFVRVIYEYVDDAVGADPIYTWHGPDDIDGSLTDDELRALLAGEDITIPDGEIPSGSSEDLVPKELTT